MKINLYIGAIEGYTSLERVKALSAELWAISRPYVVRDQKDGSVYLFPWIQHPINLDCVLKAETEQVISCHPYNDLDKIIALMPGLTQAVKNSLVALIENSQAITFGQLLTGDETIISEATMVADGWIETE